MVGKDLFIENYTYTLFFIFTRVRKEDMAFKNNDVFYTLAGGPW